MLKVIGGPVARRYLEAETRPAAEEQLNRFLVRVRRFLDEHADGDERHLHLSAEEIEKVGFAH